MKPILFELGQKVRCTPGCGLRSGMIGKIVGELAERTGFRNGRPSTRVAYSVEWEDGEITHATQVALEPAPPVRGDMDTKVGWIWIDADIAKAMKGEKE